MCIEFTHGKQTLVSIHYIICSEELTTFLLIQMFRCLQTQKNI